MVLEVKIRRDPIMRLGFFDQYLRSHRFWRGRSRPRNSNIQFLLVDDCSIEERDTYNEETRNWINDHAKHFTLLFG